MNVKIYKSSKTAMQSGRAKAGQWVLEYERTLAGKPEALMGWSAAGDTYNQVKLAFPTKEEATAYAEEKGWSYDVRDTTPKRIRPRNFSDNFKYIPVEET